MPRCASNTKREKYPLKNSNTLTQDSLNIEFHHNDGDQDGYQHLNLDQIKSILASIDPTILKQLLVEILKE